MQHVIDIAAKRAELTPDKPAFIDAETGERTTYAQLNDRAARFAALLQGRGIGRGERVAILCLNRTGFFEMLLGCGKLGAILVPLNWRQPVPELLPVLEDSGAKLLIADADNEAVAHELGTALKLPVMTFADYEAALRTTPPGDYDTLWPTERIWYLLYTSGTTGKPKAVIQTVGMCYANFVNISRAVEMQGGDTTLNFLPLFHTAGINLYTLPMLIVGGTLTIYRKFDADAVMQAIRGGACTIFFGVPAIYQAISLHPDFQIQDFSKVRSWACGGAPLPETLIRLFAARGVKVCNGFGMTETGPTVFLMDPAFAEAKIGSVGRPQVLTEVRLIDDEGRVITGADRSGEIILRGPNITPGYFCNETATTSAFTADGWLKTGDVGRRDADGYYFIVDRIKDMFISGGENVYPAEVEVVLYRFPGVLECAVLGIPDEKWGEAGCAVILPQPGAAIDVEALRAHCRKNLAGYKVPKRFEVVADFPRTAAGKIRKHILRDSLLAKG